MSAPPHDPTDDRHNDLDILDAFWLDLERIFAQYGQICELPYLERALVVFFEGQPGVIDGKELDRTLHSDTLDRVRVVDGAMDTIERAQRRHGTVGASAGRNVVLHKGANRVGAPGTLRPQEVLIGGYTAEVTVKGWLDRDMHADRPGGVQEFRVIDFEMLDAVPVVGARYNFDCPAVGAQHLRNRRVADTMQRNLEAGAVGTLHKGVDRGIVEVQTAGACWLVGVGLLQGGGVRLEVPVDPDTSADARKSQARDCCYIDCLVIDDDAYREVGC